MVRLEEGKVLGGQPFTAHRGSWRAAGRTQAKEGRANSSVVLLSGFTTRGNGPTNRPLADPALGLASGGAAGLRLSIEGFLLPPSQLRLELCYLMAVSCCHTAS